MKFAFLCLAILMSVVLGCKSIDHSEVQAIEERTLFGSSVDRIYLVHGVGVDAANMYLVGCYKEDKDPAAKVALPHAKYCSQAEREAFPDCYYAGLNERTKLDQFEFVQPKMTAKEKKGKCRILLGSSQMAFAYLQNKGQELQAQGNMDLLLSFSKELLCCSASLSSFLIPPRLIVLTNQILQYTPADVLRKDEFLKLVNNGTSSLMKEARSSVESLHNTLMLKMFYEDLAYVNEADLIDIQEYMRKSKKDYEGLIINASKDEFRKSAFTLLEEQKKIVQKNSLYDQIIKAPKFRNTQQRLSWTILELVLPEAICIESALNSLALVGEWKKRKNILAVVKLLEESRIEAEKNYKYWWPDHFNFYVNMKRQLSDPRAQQPHPETVKKVMAGFAPFVADAFNRTTQASFSQKIKTLSGLDFNAEDFFVELATLERDIRLAQKMELLWATAANNMQ